ncbi:hypothetical protein CONPUDRAFT_159767 [Coniophora puteana RWD-64-598 SS2]|uniref:Uncharacterized protein n=1 Tax=Coniophora puteana (strain RWD-64-598) TaxID=741705 RepID=A0A5M3M6X6_CONPW|nr:uncharacterized protein CONPUDRAFT_159767 [Coniophora puteana RWD-64-598 SS2]EIW75009.1 hypothetical protein CONPUDRAFT_159767 [Coniophora puteana RWD-64-598 SS2]
MFLYEVYNASPSPSSMMINEALEVEATQANDEVSPEDNNHFAEDKEHDDNETWTEPANLMSWALHPGNVDVSATSVSTLGMADDLDVNLDILQVLGNEDLG